MQSIEEALSEIKQYRDGTECYPFFVAVDEHECYRRLKDELSVQSACVRLSDFCRGKDVEPDMDALSSRLRNLTGFSALIGLGEYLALLGKGQSEAELSKLKDVLLQGGKTVVLCRGCHDVLDKFSRADPRFDSRRAFFLKRANETFDLTFVPNELDIAAFDGFKAALMALEDGERNICLKTALAFTNAAVDVKRIRSAYEGVRHITPTFGVPERCGSKEQWTRLLNELWNFKTFESVFNQHDLSRYAPGKDYAQWLYFIALKMRGTERPYLSYVLDRSDAFGDFDANMLHGILAVDPKDKKFQCLYAERKSLINRFSESELAGFVAEAKIKGADRILYLTDNTEVERKAIIECLSSYEQLTVDSASQQYPALHDYLRDFAFTCGELSQPMWNYFERYKRQKVLNRIEDGFLDTVSINARERRYNLLQTRNEVFDRLDKAGAELYFLDALGLEFMGFIQSKCAKLGLGLVVRIARANLPSITAINKDFYEAWRGKKITIKDLDHLKHDGEDGFDYQQTKLPIHLPRELDIISNVLERAKTELASGGARKIVIASDHGASRLVVVNGQELKYEVDSKGTNSGRCCAACDLQGLESATEENGYLVLANYGRFSGGRKASVEVHGGASWEEVMVPVIELMLLNKTVKVSLISKTITANFRTKAEITLFSVDDLDKVSVSVRGTNYSAEKLDANRHKVVLADVKRAGSYDAEVFEGSNLIGCVTFVVKTGTGQENDLF